LSVTSSKLELDAHPFLLETQLPSLSKLEIGGEKVAPDVLQVSDNASFERPNSRNIPLHSAIASRPPKKSLPSSNPNQEIATSIRVEIERQRTILSQVSQRLSSSSVADPESEPALQSSESNSPSVQDQIAEINARMEMLTRLVTEMMSPPDYRSELGSEMGVPTASQ
jgi:hypothetical protein